MNNVLEEILEEIDSSECYRNMAEEATTTEEKQIYMEMAQDEEKHAKYLLRLHPELSDTIEKLRVLVG